MLYTDKKDEYVIMGQIFNAKTAQNLTKERLEEINRIKFSTCPPSTHSRPSRATASV
ncbi:hypothetical protein [Massilia sp. TSP1-1-2]|uniref:hypothetical protein n=1 Tax=unclassified Massilia TaxID=2609279 RepID=UPI003CF9B330